MFGPTLQNQNHLSSQQISLESKTHNMKLIPILLTVLFLTPAFAIDSADETRSAPETTASDKPIPDVFPRWTIVGDWRVTNPDWTGILTIRPDGTVTNSIKATGRWVLTSDGGTPLLVIRWDLFGTESLAMVTQDHFRGQKRKGRFIDMQRGGDASKPISEAK